MKKKFRDASNATYIYGDYVHPVCFWALDWIIDEHQNPIRKEFREFPVVTSIGRWSDR